MALASQADYDDDDENRTRKTNLHPSGLIGFGPHFWRVGVGFRAKVAQDDQGLSLTGVFERNAGFSRVLGAEILILGELSKANELGTIERMPIDFAAALNADQAVSAIVT